MLLDVGISEYWFWPSWTHYPPEIDWRPVTLGPGEPAESLFLIEPFTWPADVGAGGPFRFYGAIVDSAWTSLVGNLGQVAFSYRGNY